MLEYDRTDNEKTSQTADPEPSVLQEPAGPPDEDEGQGAAPGAGNPEVGHLNGAAPPISGRRQRKNRRRALEEKATSDLARKIEEAAYERERLDALAKELDASFRRLVDPAPRSDPRYGKDRKATGVNPSSAPVRPSREELVEELELHGELSPASWDDALSLVSAICTLGWDGKLFTRRERRKDLQLLGNQGELMYEILIDCIREQDPATTETKLAWILEQQTQALSPGLRTVAAHVMKEFVRIATVALNPEAVAAGKYSHEEFLAAIEHLTGVLPDAEVLALLERCQAAHEAEIERIHETFLVLLVDDGDLSSREAAAKYTELTGKTISYKTIQRNRLQH
jgi:hypothetical protein